MFSVGEYIIYGVEGVCEVEEAGKLKVAGLDKNREYYRLRPYYHGGTIYTPVDGKAAMRPVLTRAELEGLLPRLPELEPLDDVPADSRAAGEYYRAILSEHDCVRLLRLCRTLHNKQQALSASRRTVSSTELRSWKMAEEMLYGVPSPPQTACFCFSLLACRLAAGRKLARAAVFSGMYFLCVLVWGGEHAGWTLGVLAGTLLACVLPPLPEHPAAEARAAAPDALDQAADVLLALEARVSPALPEPQTAPALIFDSAASAVCRSCVRQQLCWQERADETYRLLCGCAGTILRQGQAREGDLPPAFCSACIRAEAFREAVNQALRTQQAELLAFRRSEESRQIACALLGHLARFVGAAGRRPKAQGAPRWRLSLGVRAVGLRGDTLCGDAGACFQVRTLQYVLLCDGMGTGAGAKADAEEAISLLRAMITAGFAAPEAMALLNELYLLRGDGCFSTIDLLELDLCTAEGVLYKWGAAPSYLKKGGNVKKIGTASPPPGLGVGEEHRAGGVRLSLQRGELLVLTTDGVPEAACEQYLRTCGALSPRELAAGVVACASESEPDDRTAAAVQLEPVSLQPHHITRRAQNVSKAGARPHI